jgi:cobalt-zinc-cadmium efflux system outer membrane protein
LSQAAAAVEQEQGSYQQAGLYPNPQIGYLNNSSSKSSQQQSNGVFLSQEIVTAQKLRLAQQWEAREVNRVGWDAEAQRIRVLTDLHIRYYEVLGAQKSVLIGKQLERIAETGVTAAQQLLEAKSGTRAEILQAKIQLDTVRIGLDDALYRHQAAWQQLANIVGDAGLLPTLLAGEIDGELPHLDFEESWQQLVARSPQLFASQAEVDHAHAELRLARAQAVPNVTLQTVAEYDRSSQSSTVSTLVALPVPIYNRNQGNISRAAADIRGAQAEIHRVQLVLRDQLSESFRRYQSNRRQVERFRDSILPNSKENLELTTEGYNAGEFSFLQVLVARQTYFESNLAYVEALTEFRKVVAEIEGLQLTGGLNPASIGTAIQTQPGGGAQRQRALLNQVQQGSARQLLPAAQIGR